MRHYTVDTNPRTKIYFVLAVISAATATAVSSGTSLVPFHFTAPSSMFIFALLISIFDRFIWKWRMLRWWVGIPNLDGTWSGKLVRLSESNGAPEDHEVSVTITQDWRKMSIVFEGQRSKSAAEVIALHVENRKDISIKWIYSAKDRSGINPGNLYGQGTTDAWLKVVAGRRTLEGTYYSSKLRKGFIKLVEEG